MMTHNVNLLTRLSSEPFLRLLSRQSRTVRRWPVRKSYRTLEEKACRSDSRAARRVFALEEKDKQSETLQ